MVTSPVDLVMDSSAKFVGLIFFNRLKSIMLGSLRQTPTLSPFETDLGLLAEVATLHSKEKDPLVTSSFVDKACQPQKGKPKMLQSSDSSWNTQHRRGSQLLMALSKEWHSVSDWPLRRLMVRYM